MAMMARDSVLSESGASGLHIALTIQEGPYPSDLLGVKVKSPLEPGLDIAIL
jgi:hypothetical protein